MAFRRFLRALPFAAALAPGALTAAESTAVMGVTAIVANACEVAAKGATAHLTCSHPANVTVLRSGADPVLVPLEGAQPRLIPLTESDGGQVLVIAY